MAEGSHETVAYLYKSQGSDMIVKCRAESDDSSPPGSGTRITASGSSKMLRHSMDPARAALGYHPQQTTSSDISCLWANSTLLSEETAQTGIGAEDENRH